MFAYSLSKVQPKKKKKKKKEIRYILLPYILSVRFYNSH